MLGGYDRFGKEDQKRIKCKDYPKGVRVKDGEETESVSCDKAAANAEEKERLCKNGYFFSECRKTCGCVKPKKKKGKNKGNKGNKRFLQRGKKGKKPKDKKGKKPCNDESSPSEKFEIPAKLKKVSCKEALDECDKP